MICRREDVVPVCERLGIPDYMYEAVERWLFDHEECGAFFMAVVRNDLVGALGKADERNLSAIHAWGGLLYNEFPGKAWGSDERVKKWMEKGEQG